MDAPSRGANLSERGRGVRRVRGRGRVRGEGRGRQRIPAGGTSGRERQLPTAESPPSNNDSHSGRPTAPSQSSRIAERTISLFFSCFFPCFIPVLSHNTCTDPMAAPFEQFALRDRHDFPVTSMKICQQQIDRIHPPAIRPSQSLRRQRVTKTKQTPFGLLSCQNVATEKENEEEAEADVLHQEVSVVQVELVVVDEEACSLVEEACVRGGCDVLPMMQVLVLFENCNN